MNKVKLLVLILCISIIVCDNCTIDLSQRYDCGYLNINTTQCYKRGCCYHKLSGYASCYYSVEPSACKEIFFDGRNGPGFDEDFQSKMYGILLKNINIQGKGGVQVANDINSPDSYYDWMRDSSIVMRAYMQYNDWKYSAIQQKMKAYIGWIGRTQRQIDSHGFDARVNPKFQLPNGQIYRGTANRPQSDGVGARACNLLLYTQILLDHGDTYEALTNVLPLIKFDLDWILINWQSKSYSPFNSVLFDDFFWNRAGYVDALSLCTQVFTRVNDLQYAQKCSSLKQIIKKTLDNHWTGSYIAQYNSSKDSLVLHALSSYDIYPKTDDRIAKTIDVLGKMFCVMFRVNQIDSQPGILLGNVLGGTVNIRPEFTGVLAKLLYQKASYALTHGFEEEQDKTAWAKLLKFLLILQIYKQLKLRYMQVILF